ncbi:MAG: DUF11 domain-containing protein [Chloroflexi bacterium]|nr:DUF11 domain-containing protein [Chloroflexota bacterium]
MSQSIRIPIFKKRLSAVSRQRRWWRVFILVLLIVQPFTPLNFIPGSDHRAEAAPLNWCVAGSFQGWNNSANPLYDDGSNGDLVANDGIASADYSIGSAGSYEFKAVECGNWGNAYPPNNAWFVTTSANQVVKFTLDTRTYPFESFRPRTNIVNTADTWLTGFTAVGSFQGWNNTDPAAALTNLGGGIWSLDYSVAAAGTYEAKIVETGNWAHQFTHNGRVIDGAGWNFTTTQSPQTVNFTLNLNIGRIKIQPVVSPGTPSSWCIAGGFQGGGWNNASHPLYDDGSNGDAVAGDGVFSREINISGRHEWKIFECGNWGVGFPNSNAWVNAAGGGQNILFTFDTNSYADSFVPSTNIVHANDNLGADFSAVGSFNGWNNADNAARLTHQGGGIYEGTYVVPSTGSYVAKITRFGTWDTFGGTPGGRTTDQTAAPFDTSGDNEPVRFTIDTNTGRIKVTPAGAPPAIWDTVYHAACNSRLAADCTGPGDHASLEQVPGQPAGTHFSSVTYNGAPVGDGVTDVYAYDDDPISMYMMGHSGELTDDAQYPYIRYWTGSEQFANMSLVDSYTGVFHGVDTAFDVFNGSIPAQRPGNIYYWLTAQHDSTTTRRGLCMTGTDNVLGQAISGGDCSFNDYAFAVLDDDSSGPQVANLTFSDGGDGLGGGNDQVCADVIETGTDSGDNDSAVGAVTLRYSALLGDVIIGSGSEITMTLSAGVNYCASGLSFNNPTYYRIEAVNNDQDHPDDGDYSDLDTGRSAPDCEGAACDFPVGDNNIHWNEVYHNTRTLDYRDPFGAVPAGSTVTIGLRTAANDLTFVFLQLYNTPSGNAAHAMNKVSTDGTYDTWEATITAADTADIGQLYYKFILMDGTAEDWYVDDWSHNQYDHEDRYENGSGQMVDDGTAGTYTNSSFNLTVYAPDMVNTVPDWAQNAVIYQIMPDRFRNGDPANDEAWPTGYDVYGLAPLNHDTWNEAPINPRADPYMNYFSADFFGGDLQGIMDELDYLESIGVTAIYLNPIFMSPSNHGYDTTDYMNINTRYGDNALFAQLAAEAEERGIYLILDGVFNHSGSDSRYFDRYNRWDVDGSASTGNDGTGACEAAGSVFAGFYTLIDDGTGPCYGGRNYESWFGYDSLPVLIDTVPNSILRDYVFDVNNNGSNGIDGSMAVIQYWYSLGADGWRFDVANEIPHDFWQQFRSQVKTNDSLTGPLYSEVWYEAQPWVLGDELDSTMNYRYRKAVLGFLVDSEWTDNDNNGDQTMYQLTPTQFDYVLGSIREDYPAPSLYAMMNLMGSHDTNRALFVLREESADLNTALNKLKMMAALQFTFPGAPTIYYGDEAGIGAADYGGYGLWGAGYGAAGSQQDDPYNRHTYPWNPDTENAYNTWSGSGEYNFDSVTGPVPPTNTYTPDLREHYQILGLTRSSYPVLRDGEVSTVLIHDADQLYGYARHDGTHCAIAIFNRSTAAHPATTNVDLPLPAECSGTFYDVLHGGAAYNTVGTQITIPSLPGLESAVLVQGLNSNGLILPPAGVTINALANDLPSGGTTNILATFTDVTGNPVPAGVTVNFSVLAGGGSLSSASAITNASGLASVDYTAGGGSTTGIIQASLNAPNGKTYSGSVTVYSGYGATTLGRLTVETGIGPHFANGLTAGAHVAATKIGTGEPVIGLAEYSQNPYLGDDPVQSSFVDVSLSSDAGVDMLAVGVLYTDETDEANHQLFWWDGNGWIETSAVIVDTVNNEVVFEVTGETSPSLSELTGTVFVAGDPGYYREGSEQGGQGGTATGSLNPMITKTGELGAGQVGLIGDQVIWRISVTNPGTATAANLVITDTLPAELRITTVEMDRGSASVNGQTVIFTIPWVDPGETINLSVYSTIVQTPTADTINNTAGLTGISADGSSITGSASGSVQVASKLPSTGYPPDEESDRSSWYGFVLAGGVVVVVGSMIALRKRQK